MLDRIRSHFTNDVVGYSKMEGGYTNYVYRIDLEDRSLVYKEYYGKNENEKNILNLINIPKILINEEEYRIEEYLENTPIDYLSDMKGIIVSMREMHCKKLHKNLGEARVLHKNLEEVSNFENLFENIMNQAGNEVSDDIKSKIFGILEDNKFALGLCHNDLQPNNMLKTDLGIVIIDYEFSTIGNILFDIANLFCETHLNYEENVYDLTIGYQKDDEEKFLRFYFDEKVDLNEIKIKVENLKIISHFLWFFWAIPKAKGEGTQDFDYVKYAKGRLREIEKTGILSKEEVKSLLSLLKR